MSKILTFLLIIAVLVFGYVLFGEEKISPKQAKKSSVKKEEVVKREFFSGEASVQSSVGMSKLPGGTSLNSEEKSIPVLSAAEFSLDVQAPAADMTVASPFFVQGRAKGGNSFVVRILNSSKKVLIEEKMNLSAALDGDGYRSFQTKLNYLFTNTKDGFLQVVLMDEKGEERNQQEVPLKFL